jgi:hypothetical protein
MQHEGSAGSGDKTTNTVRLSVEISKSILASLHHYGALSRDLSRSIDEADYGKAARVLEERSAIIRTLNGFTGKGLSPVAVSIEFEEECRSLVKALNLNAGELNGSVAKMEFKILKRLEELQKQRAHKLYNTTGNDHGHQ